MPYKLKRSVAGGKPGWRVQSKDGTYLSKKALPKERAMKQMTAVILTELGIKRKK